MECLKCKSNSPHQANYCSKCGNRYTDKDKENDFDKGFTGFLNKLKDWHDNAHLDFITSNVFYKYGSIILIIIIGVLGIVLNGNDVKVVDSFNYEYQYNTKNKEYYVYAEEDDVKLNIYSVGKINDILVEYYDENNSLISSDNYQNNDDVKLKTNTVSDNYYKITINNKSIKTFIYDKNVVSLNSKNK